MISNALIGGPLLLRNLAEAVKMAKKCAAACEDFEKHWGPNIIYQWKMMKRSWELDPSQPDPYQIVEKGEPFIQNISSFLTLGCRSRQLQRCKA